MRKLLTRISPPVRMNRSGAGSSDSDRNRSTSSGVIESGSSVPSRTRVAIARQAWVTSQRPP